MMLKNRLKSLFFLASVILLASVSQAQESVNTSGGDVSQSEGTVSYSIGQVVYSTFSSSSGIINEGVQHAYEIFTVGTIEPSFDVSFTVFPNPSAHKITIQTINYQDNNMSYTLYDMQGKLLLSGNIKAHDTQLDLHSLPSASYILHIANESNNTLKSFKIIKNQ